LFPGFPPNAVEFNGYGKSYMNGCPFFLSLLSGFLMIGIWLIWFEGLTKKLGERKRHKKSSNIEEQLERR
jgi:hypothetical protein